MSQLAIAPDGQRLVAAPSGQKTDGRLDSAPSTVSDRLSEGKRAQVFAFVI